MQMPPLKIYKSIDDATCVGFLYPHNKRLDIIFEAPSPFEIHLKAAKFWEVEHARAKSVLGSSETITSTRSDIVGTKWIHRGTERRRVPLDQTDTFKADGWLPGRG